MTGILSATYQPKYDGMDDLEIVISETTRKRLTERAQPWRSALPSPAQPLPAQTLPALPPRIRSGRRIARRSAMPGRRRMLAIRSVCRMVRMVAAEMVFLLGDRTTSSRDRRFALSHIQQIAMYVCHVVLQLTMTEIGEACGKDRTTVGHACARVEDRRDDVAYDQLVAAIERVVGNLFGSAGTQRH
jgi:hypothetical protein